MSPGQKRLSSFSTPRPHSAPLPPPSQGMSHLARDCLGVMFERQGEDAFLCDPELFFHKFRPYISTWTAIFEGQFECGPLPHPAAFTLASTSSSA